MNPTSAQLETELKHEKRKHSYNRALRSTLYTLLVVAAVAVLIATMVMPILQITGTSMTPVVGQGENHNGRARVKSAARRYYRFLLQQ